MMNNILRRPFRYCNYNSVYWLIGINVLVFFLMNMIGRNIVFTIKLNPSRLPEYYQRLPQVMQVNLQQALSIIPLTVIHGWIWSFVTYMFMHGGISHILFNMLGLFIFGRHVENQMGTKEFLLYYFVTGTLAGVFSFLVYYFTGNLRVALVGASGALYAVNFAYAVFFPDSVIYIWGILPLRAPVMVLVFTVISIFSAVSGSGGNVAHLTHLAGFGFGWIYFMVRFGINPWQRLTRR